MLKNCGELNFFFLHLIRLEYYSFQRRGHIFAIAFIGDIQGTFKAKKIHYYQAKNDKLNKYFSSFLTSAAMLSTPPGGHILRSSGLNGDDETYIHLQTPSLVELDVEVVQSSQSVDEVVRQRLHDRRWQTTPQLLGYTFVTRPPGVIIYVITEFLSRFDFGPVDGTAKPCARRTLRSRQDFFLIIFFI